MASDKPTCCWSEMWSDYFCTPGCESCRLRSKEPSNELVRLSEPFAQLAPKAEPFETQQNSDELLHSLEELYKAVRQTFSPKN